MMRAAVRRAVRWVGVRRSGVRIGWVGLMIGGAGLDEFDMYSYVVGATGVG